MRGARTCPPPPQAACRNDRLARALDLAGRLNLLKSLEIAVKLAQRTQHTALAQRIHDMLEVRPSWPRLRGSQCTHLLAGLTHTCSHAQPLPRDQAKRDAELASRSPTPEPAYTSRPLVRALDMDAGASTTPLTDRNRAHKRARKPVGGDRATPSPPPPHAQGSDVSPTHGPTKRRKGVVMVDGERRSKVAEEEDDDEAGVRTPASPRRGVRPTGGGSLLRKPKRRSFDAPPPRNPFAKRIAASPQKKNQHVLESLARRSPQKPKGLQLSRSSSFAIKGTCWGMGCDWRGCVLLAHHDLPSLPPTALQLATSASWS